MEIRPDMPSSQARRLQQEQPRVTCPVSFPVPRPRTPSASSSPLGPLCPPIAHDHPFAHSAYPHPVTHSSRCGKKTHFISTGIHVQRNIATQPKRPPRRAGRRDKLPLHKARARRTQVPSLTARKPSPSPALFDGLKVLDPHQSSRGGRVIVEMLLRARHRSVSGELERRRPAALTCAFCVRELLRAIGALYCRGGTVQQSPVACGRPPGAVPGGRWDDGRGTSDAADCSLFARRPTQRVRSRRHHPRQPSTAQFSTDPLKGPRQRCRWPQKTLSPFWMMVSPPSPLDSLNRTLIHPVPRLPPSTDASVSRHFPISPINFPHRSRGFSAVQPRSRKDSRSSPCSRHPRRTQIKRPRLSRRPLLPAGWQACRGLAARRHSRRRCSRRGQEEVSVVFFPTPPLCPPTSLISRFPFLTLVPPAPIFIVGSRASSRR